MKYLAILIIAVIGLAAADHFADYVPKAFFTIDENGNPSAARPINSETLNRVRRQIQPIQPFGQPGFGFQPFPGFPQAGFNQGKPGQSTFTSSSQTLSSRFGEDEPVVSGQTTVIHGNNGVYQQTNTVLRPDGSVHTNKQSGRVRRQQSQTQNQQGDQGTQFQSQNQGQPGSDQFQSQTQGQNVAPIVTPAAGNQQPHSDNRNDQNYPQGQGQGGQGQGGQGQGGQHQPQGGQQYPQGGQQSNYPQGGQQSNYPEGQQNYQPQGNYQPQPNYQQQPSGYQQQGFQQGGFGAPFGLGAFQPGFGMQPGFAFAPGFFPQPGFGAFGTVPAFQPAPGQGVVGGSTLHNRFGEDEPAGGISTGGTQTITSQNGVFHSTSSILKPDGQVVTSHQSGKFPK